MANAVSPTEDYLDFSALTRMGLIQQLSWDSGDGYPHNQAECGFIHAGL